MMTGEVLGEYLKVLKEDTDLGTLMKAATSVISVYQ